MKLWTTLIQGPITKDKECLGYIDKYKEAIQKAGLNFSIKIITNN